MKTLLLTSVPFVLNDQIKALGGHWNAAERGFDIPADKAAAACKLFLLVKGNTWPARGRLKKLGGKFDPETKSWAIPANQVQQVKSILQHGTLRHPRAKVNPRQGN